MTSTNSTIMCTSCWSRTTTSSFTNFTFDSSLQNAIYSRYKQCEEKPMHTETTASDFTIQNRWRNIYKIFHNKTYSVELFAVLLVYRRLLIQLPNSTEMWSRVRKSCSASLTHSLATPKVHLDSLLITTATGTGSAKPNNT
jgi:hypothetical protein